MNYPITYELTTESGGQSNEFAIDSSSGVVDLLRTLDYETDPVQYHLRVKAIENRRRPVTSTVNVRSLQFCFANPLNGRDVNCMVSLGHLGLTYIFNF